MYDDKNLDELVNSILKNRDMIDEDELIVDDEKKVVEKREGFKKKPCANCNCSRKSEDTKKKSYSSKCGNCYLGDAFRCASCPYNGMPAFEPGEEMFFESDDLNKV